MFASIAEDLPDIADVIGLADKRGRNTVHLVSNAELLQIDDVLRG